ncbi:MAG: HD-GYP domain-containing protein [Gammaproteobacteria bacterium]
MESKISTQNLQLNMFVSRLDRPWLGTPFPIEGVWIQDQATINLLQQHCQYVFIRTDRVREAIASNPERAGVKRAQNAVLDRLLSPGGLPLASPVSASALATGHSPSPGGNFGGVVDFRPVKPTFYEDRTTLEEEYSGAHGVRRELREALSEILEDVKHGKAIHIVAVKAAVRGMMESILRNPDAAMWLRLMKDKNGYAHYHHVDTSALAVAMGRHLGFTSGEISNLGLGALLSNIGTANLPSDLLMRSNQLSEDEVSLVRRHVESAVALLTETPGVGKQVIDIIACRHEWFDGSGYPNGLRGAAIPVFGRIVAIAEWFDACTSNRQQVAAISPHAALQHLYRQRNTRFQAELVEQFIQTLGVYPTGTLVELTTGEIGVVISQNRVRQLRPRIMLMLGSDKSHYKSYPIVDLFKQATDQSGNPLSIVRAVDPAQYGIETQQFFLSSVCSKLLDRSRGK